MLSTNRWRHLGRGGSWFPNPAEMGEAQTNKSGFLPRHFLPIVFVRSAWARDQVVEYEDTAFYLEADTFDPCGGHATTEGIYLPLPWHCRLPAGAGWGRRGGALAAAWLGSLVSAWVFCLRCGPHIHVISACCETLCLGHELQRETTCGRPSSCIPGAAVYFGMFCEQTTFEANSSVPFGIFFDAGRVRSHSTAGSK